MATSDGKSRKQENPKIEVIPDSKKIWGWNTDAWDLPEGVVVDLGLDSTGTNKALARDWGWNGW